jgi:hemin uptake protein HemP
MSETSDEPAGASQPRPAAPPREVPARRVLESRELFAGGHELHIEHNGFVYTLRLTSKGKLILTK